MERPNITIDTYNNSAGALSEYFRGIGPRVQDIELGLNLAGSPQSARAVEIGCGDGRDAAEIIQRVGWYEGFDPSNGLLNIARENLPDTNFVTADHLSYKFPEDLDVVYAFASLLHVNREDFKVVFDRVHESLRESGIFYMSLKERAQYEEEIKKDKFGERMFYFYNVDEIKKLMGNNFEIAFEDHQNMADTDWFTLALMNKKGSPDY